MSDFKRDGDRPAFPVECYYPPNDSDKQPHGIQTANHEGWETGLTVRQWLAGMALPSIPVSRFREFDPKSFAQAALAIADAIIEESAQ